MTAIKRKRLLSLIFYVIFANLIIYFWQPSYFASLLFVYFPPMLANFYWLKGSRTEVLVFSLATLLLFAPPIELLARSADAWDVASIFPRILGTMPLENLVYAFINFFWILCFYEYFIDKDLPAKIPRKFRILMILYLLLFISIFSLFLIDDSLAAVNYWVLGVGIMIPALAIFARKPKLLKKTLIPTLFFMFAFFINEVVSMEVGYWWWPGEYLWAVNLLGNVFPIDDVIIWYVLSTPALIGGYEFFMDDFR